MGQWDYQVKGGPITKRKLTEEELAELLEVRPIIPPKEAVLAEAEEEQAWREGHYKVRTFCPEYQGRDK